LLRLCKLFVNPLFCFAELEAMYDCGDKKDSPTNNQQRNKDEEKNKLKKHGYSS